MKCTLRLLAGLLVLGTTSVLAGATYQESLKAGDSYRAAGVYDRAMAEFEAGLTQAANSTEEALALGKMAEVLAFNKNDFVKARELADKALSKFNVEPVGRVTALQVKAHCQIKGDNDRAAAITTLEQAAALPGVDWAMPAVQMELGDCYRMTDNAAKALAAYESIIAMSQVSPEVKATAYLNIGLTRQYNLQNPASAKDSYQKAVSLMPSLEGEVKQHLSTVP